MTVERHLELQELLASYALGALEPEERARVERHLEEGCAECDAELLAWSRTAEAVADSVEPIAPSEHVRARLVRALEPAAPETVAAAPIATAPRRRRWVARAGWAAAAAAALALAVTGSAVVELRGRVQELESSATTATRQVADLRRELDDARGRLMQAARAARIAASPEMRSVQLAGLEGAPRASAQTLVDPRGGRAVFYASDLPPVEADRTYQLWLIADGVPVSAGVFAADADGGAQVVVERLPAPETIEAWAVTVEPEGGVPQPTGPMVLLG